VGSNRKETTKMPKTIEDIMHCAINANMYDRMKMSKRIKEI